MTDVHFSLEQNLRTSYQVHALKHGLSFWQIGLDRLEEFTEIVYTMFTQHSLRLNGGELKQTGEDLYKKHLNWLKNSVLVGVCNENQEIGATGAIIPLYKKENGREKYFSMEGFENSFDPPALVREYRPTEIWLATRNASSQEIFKSAARTLQAVRAINTHGFGRMFARPDTLLLGLVEAPVLRRMQKSGQNWKALGEQDYEIPLVSGMFTRRILLDTNDPLKK